METVNATITWIRDDSVVIYAEPLSALWDVEGAPNSDHIAVFHEVDDNEVRTGRIAGIEVIGLLNLEESEIPDLPAPWKLPGREPASLKDLLMALKAEAKRGSVAKAS